MADLTETRYGFRWGAADVERTMSDDREGWVLIRIQTDYVELQVAVSRTGRSVRTFQHRRTRAERRRRERRVD